MPSDYQYDPAKPQPSAAVKRALPYAQDIDLTGVAVLREAVFKRCRREMRIRKEVAPFALALATRSVTDHAAPVLYELHIEMGNADEKRLTLDIHGWFAAKAQVVWYAFVSETWDVGHAGRGQPRDGRGDAQIQVRRRRPKPARASDDDVHVLARRDDQHGMDG